MDYETLILIQAALWAVMIFLYLLMIAGMWAVCRKADMPGWSQIIPFYNLYILGHGVARLDQVWWILALVPGLGLFAFGVICGEVARRFGRGVAFGLGLALFPFLFWPIIGFNDDRYIKKLVDRGPKAPRNLQDDDDDDYEDDDDEFDDQPVRRRRR